jgi:hypothetical protein
MMSTEKRVVVCKADPVGDEVIPTVIIEISASYPSVDVDHSKEGSLREWEERVEELQEYEARTIAKALKDSLPGGIYNRLIAVLVEDAAGYFRVRAEWPKPVQAKEIVTGATP